MYVSQQKMAIKKGTIWLNDRNGFCAIRRPDLLIFMKYLFYVHLTFSVFPDKLVLAGIYLCSSKALLKNNFVFPLQSSFCLILNYPIMLSLTWRHFLLCIVHLSLKSISLCLLWLVWVFVFEFFCGFFWFWVFFWLFFWLFWFCFLFFFVMFLQDFNLASFVLPSLAYDFSDQSWNQTIQTSFALCLEVNFSVCLKCLE